MNMKRIIASALFSFFVAQSALATDHAPPFGACLIAECREGFSLDTKNCRCVSDSKVTCQAVIRCREGFDVDPKTCRCIKEDIFMKGESTKPMPMKAESSKPTKPEKPELFPKFDPSKPGSGDPTPAKPEPKTIPEPKIPCPPQRLCYP